MLGRCLLIALVVAGLGGCEEDDLNHIPVPGSIGGLVCDPGEHEGIGGAAIWVHRDNDPTAARIETASAGDGTFELVDVPPGTYTVYVKRGSFTSQVDDVVVEEETLTSLEESEACIAPEGVSMIVYDGHDSVEQVLNRLGYTDFELVDSHHEWNERDENTPSWLVEAFADPVALDNYDIVFINCAAHEWAIDRASDEDLEAVLGNLRRFVQRGGSLYLSDWSYDLMELLYPDAVDWIHDDAVPNAAEVGIAQDFLARVGSEDLEILLQRGEVFLTYELSRIAIPRVLGEGARSLVTADILAEVPVPDGEPEPDEPETELLEDVPVLLEYRPAAFDEETETGRVIYTTFHNGPNNTRDMDDVLRAIIFSL